MVSYITSTDRNYNFQHRLYIITLNGTLTWCMYLAKLGTEFPPFFWFRLLVFCFFIFCAGNFLFICFDGVCFFITVFQFFVFILFSCKLHSFQLNNLYHRTIEKQNNITFIISISWSRSSMSHSIISNQFVFSIKYLF